MKKVKLELSGLSCGHCIARVKAALEKAGARVNEVNLNEAEIEVAEDESVEKYIQAVQEVGYAASLKE
ncbi:cation transporter [Archaeoglobus neptunius]|uniref:cation transporter n=1 Tax=Archaeoglobus neptunius TaxID=2798580 RepID=UPI002EDA0F84